MKLNIDCMRDILIQLEKLDFNQLMYLDELVQQLPNYTDNDIKYSCLKLMEADFINGISSKYDSEPLEDVYCIYDITFSGHQFIASVRSNSSWNKVKSASIKLGMDSIPVLLKIATQYAEVAIPKILSSI